MSSGLLLRFSPDEHLVRSVGDRPNGALTTMQDEAGCFHLSVSPSWMPPADGDPPRASGGRLLQAADDQWAGFVPVDALDAARACETEVEAQALWTAACLVGVMAFQGLEPGDPAPAHAAAAFATEVAEALATAGWLT
jgi:hypothetical protein